MPVARVSKLKILIIRFSSIGDIILCSPVIRCLKKQSDAEVHFLSKDRFASLLQPNPYLDKVHLIRSDVKEVSRQLRSENYDYIIDLHKNFRSFQARMAARAPCFSFNKLNLEKWLLVNFKLDRLPDKHIVNRYMAAVEKLEVTYDGAGLDFFMPEATEIKIGEPGFQLRLSAAGGFPAGSIPDYIAFGIGGAHATKRLPENKIRDICAQLPGAVLLLGGREESAVAERVVRAFKNVYNMCGKTSLHQTGLLIKHAAAVISHDTATMHMAAAFQKPLVSVWGNTVPQFGMYPYFKSGVHHHHIAAVDSLSCRPCSKIGYKKMS